MYRSKAYTRLYITVTNAPPNLSPGYARPNSTYTRGARMANNTVDSSLGGGQSSAATYANAFFTVSPALPSGLALDPNTGTISGIPMVSVITSHVITASNYGGRFPQTANTSVQITVLEGAYLDRSTGLASPESGPTTGGTVLMLRTGGSEKRWSAPPRCWFGSLEDVSGAWISLEDGTFRCISPDGASPGTVPLTVSFEGGPGRAEVLRLGGQPVVFTYYDDTKQGEGVSYSVKSASMSGTSLDLEWTADTGDVFCPTREPVTREPVASHRVRLKVQDLYDLFELEASCDGDQSTTSTRDCFVTCEVPSLAAMAIKPRKVSFRIAMNGQQFHTLEAADQEFSYTETQTPMLALVSPSVIAAGLNHTLVLSGSSFQPDQTGGGACVFNASCGGVPPFANASGLRQAASTIQENTIVCPLPQSMLSLSAAACTLRVSLMNTDAQQSDELPLSLFALPRIETVAPMYAPLHGGTTVTISGAGLAQEHESVKVRFDEIQVDGTWLADGTVQAVSPPVPSAGIMTLQVALNGLQYSTNSSAQLHTFGVKLVRPRAVPENRSLPIRVSLSGLIEPTVSQTVGWACAFGAAAAVAPSAFDASAKTLLCDSPLGAANTTDTVHVSALGSAQTAAAAQISVEYYRPFKLLGLSRYAGPKQGDVRVQLLTDSLVQSADGLFCSYNLGEYTQSVHTVRSIRAQATSSGRPEGGQLCTRPPCPCPFHRYVAGGRVPLAFRRPNRGLHCARERGGPGGAIAVTHAYGRPAGHIHDAVGP